MKLARNLTLLAMASILGCTTPESDDSGNVADADTDADTDSDADADTDSDADADADIEIIGTWSTEFGSTHTITDTTWDEAGDGYANAFAITQYDNDSDYAVAQNASTNAYNPSLWSRFDWTIDGDGAYWYCQTAYAAETENDASAAAAADATDPGTSGCGGFSWTKLTASTGR